MNENTTNASERETLVATQEAVVERFKEICRKAVAHQKQTMEDWIERLGLGGKLRVERVNLGSGMSVTTMPDESGRTDDIFVWFRTDFDGARNPDGSKRRSLEISMRSTRLMVGREEDLLMAVVAGKFAENVAAMEADFRTFDWALFDRTARAVYAADEALRDFDAAAKRAEFDRKAAEMLARLTPGVKVNFGKPYAWANDEVVQTIEKVTAKSVLRADGSRRQRKLAEVLRNLVNGIFRIVD